MYHDERCLLTANYSVRCVGLATALSNKKKKKSKTQQPQEGCPTTNKGDARRLGGHRKPHDVISMAPFLLHSRIDAAAW